MPESNDKRPLTGPGSIHLIKLNFRAAESGPEAKGVEKLLQHAVPVFSPVFHFLFHLNR